MGKDLSQRLRETTESMSAEVARLELARAYLHMYKCTEVLRGHDVEPVALDDDEAIGEELFYLCKKKAIEEGLFPQDRISARPSVDVRFSYDSDRKSLYSPGDDVWYWNGAPRHCRIESVEYSDESGWEVSLENGAVLKGFAGLYRTKDDLFNGIARFVYG